MSAAASSSSSSSASAKSLYWCTKTTKGDDRYFRQEDGSRAKLEEVSKYEDYTGLECKTVEVRKSELKDKVTQAIRNVSSKQNLTKIRDEIGALKAQLAGIQDKEFTTTVQSATLSTDFQSKIIFLNNKIRELQSQLGECTTTASTQSGKIAQLEENLRGLQERYNALNAQKESLEKQLLQLQMTHAQQLDEWKSKKQEYVTATNMLRKKAFSLMKIMNESKTGTDPADLQDVKLALDDLDQRMGRLETEYNVIKKDHQQSSSESQQSIAEIRQQLAQVTATLTQRNIQIQTLNQEAEDSQLQLKLMGELRELDAGLDASVDVDAAADFAEVKAKEAALAATVTSVTLQKGTDVMNAITKSSQAALTNPTSTTQAVNTVTQLLNRATQVTDNLNNVHAIVTAASDSAANASVLASSAAADHSINKNLSTPVTPATSSSSSSSSTTSSSSDLKDKDLTTAAAAASSQGFQAAKVSTTAATVAVSYVSELEAIKASIDSLKNDSDIEKAFRKIINTIKTGKNIKGFPNNAIGQIGAAMKSVFDNKHNAVIAAAVKNRLMTETILAKGVMTNEPAAIDMLITLIRKFNMFPSEWGG